MRAFFSIGAITPSSGSSGTIYLQEDYNGYPTGNASLTSAWTNNGYINIENSGTASNVAILGRSSMPAGLLADSNFPSGKTQVLCFTLPGDEVQARATWAGMPNTTTRSWARSWWEYRDNANKGGEKFDREGNYVSGTLGGSRGIDCIYGLGQVTGVTLFANSANMHDFGDHGYGDIFSPWPPGLRFFEVITTIPTDTSATGSVEMWMGTSAANLTQIALATGLQFFDNSTEASIGLQLWDFGGWSSTSGGAEGVPTYPIQRYICAARIASTRQGFWPMSAV